MGIRTIRARSMKLLLSSTQLATDDRPLLARLRSHAIPVTVGVDHHFPERKHGNRKQLPAELGDSDPDSLLSIPRAWLGPMYVKWRKSQTGSLRRSKQQCAWRPRSVAGWRGFCNDPPLLKNLHPPLSPGDPTAAQN